ncbi:carbohydrate ABC transporter permease [Neoactinobaculum massilliense]|uniref:carbohydrate ABC transporter permease n=1 Tax=Neoactinobaculum massilliense TaxID=2364794 RepID=UPI000F548BBA|nr:carbohydrate ABC transporter permease [Neoactinobaculum massilliense]
MKPTTYRINRFILHIGLIALGIITVFPFIWMLLSSFKPNSEIVSANPSLLPHVWTLENYLSISDKFNFFRLFGNSLFLALIITALVIYTSLLGGYVFAKYSFRGRGTLFAVVLSTMMITWAVVIIPRYTMFESAGLRGSYLSIILPAAFSGFGIFMMRQSISTIPNELLEAARIDGASESLIFHRIIVPLSANSISALAIFQFLWVWEDYLWPYLMITDQDKQVLSVGLTTFSGQYSTDYGGLFAATSISIIPVLLVYVIFQSRFVAGASSAAVKG